VVDSLVLIGRLKSANDENSPMRTLPIIELCDRMVQEGLILPAQQHRPTGTGRAAAVARWLL
jgi:hypothetical protein